MIYRLLADAVLLLHLAFIVFVVCGGFLAQRRPRIAWLHLPAAAWGAFVELAAWPCPLTPLENHFRGLAGTVGYGKSFVEHYLVPAIYPQELLREGQIALGIAVVVINVVAYGRLFRNARRDKQHRN